MRQWTSSSTIRPLGVEPLRPLEGGNEFVRFLHDDAGGPHRFASAKPA